VNPYRYSASNIKEIDMLSTLQKASAALAACALVIISWSAVITVPGQAVHPTVTLTQLA
jgi:hypothetical protein